MPNKTPPELKPYLPASCGEPAFYSNYTFPNNLQPGLNQEALRKACVFSDINYTKDAITPDIKPSTSFNQLQQQNITPNHVSF